MKRKLGFAIPIKKETRIYRRNLMNGKDDALQKFNCSPIITLLLDRPSIKAYKDLFVFGCIFACHLGRTLGYLLCAQKTCKFWLLIMNVV